MSRACLALGPGDAADADVRIMVDVVGVGMVPGVFSDPPAVAQPDAKVAQEQTGDPGVALGGEDLLVPDVVGKERDPGIDHSQPCGDRDL